MICVNVLPDKSIVFDSISDVCTTTFSLVSSSDFTKANDLISVLNALFAFDAELFAIVEGAMIMGFLSSHFGGRVVRWLGKG